MGQASNQSVAYGSGPEWPTHDYPNNPNVSRYSLIKFLNYDERPFSERLVAGHLYDTYKEPVESSLERWERSWSTAGNVTSEQHGIQSFVPGMEAELTHRITEWLVNWLRQWAAAAPLVDGSSGGSRTTNSGHAPGAGTASGKPSNSNAAGKRRRKPGKDGDEDNNEQSKKAKTGSSRKSQEKHVACPWIKHNPQRYGHDKKCRGRWADVSRLKNDHIYQYHQVPGVQCPRCGGIIHNHNKSEHISCAEQNFVPREGADSSMMQELRSKSTARNESEAAKWSAVYQILFGVPRERQPSPYADDYSHFRQEMVNFLQPNIFPTVLRVLQAHDITHGRAQNVCRDIVNEVLGLVGDFQPTSPPTALPHDHDPSPSSSSETRGQSSCSHANQSHTQYGYTDQLGGNPIPGEFVEGGSAAQTIHELNEALIRDCMPRMSSSLTGVGGQYQDDAAQFQWSSSTTYMPYP